MIKIVSLIFSFSLLFTVTPVWGNIVLHKLFQDHMVLQQGQAVPIWGTGSNGEVVSVSFNGQNISTTVSNGKWKIVLDTMNYGGPYKMVVQGANIITLQDIYVGEVWLCSGQSNMEYSLPDSEAPTVSNPLIRTIKIPKSNGYIPSPLTDIERGAWYVSTPSTTAGYFSAVGYYLARTLSDSLKVAVGIINATYGGTNVEAWTSLATQQTSSQLLPVLSYWKGKDSTKEWYPANLYNGMIHPIAPFAIKGVCWYQGETVTSNGVPYSYQLQALIQDWRNLWGVGNFPFNIVQLPNYGPVQTAPDEGTSGWKAVQEAQFLTMRKMQNVGMVVTIDIGDTGNIHPTNKLDVGYRLGLWALANTYSKNITYSGPLYKSMAIEGSSIRLKFDHAENMVAKGGGELTGFAISGPDKKFVWGNAKIDGTSIVVSSPQIKSPTIVRYAWHSNTPIFNLYNKAGLPASPFRTDGTSFTTNYGNRDIPIREGRLRSRVCLQHSSSLGHQANDYTAYNFMGRKAWQLNEGKNIRLENKFSNNIYILTLLDKKK